MTYRYGERIVLREYRMEDLGSIKQWVNNKEITQMLSDIFTYPRSEYQSEQFVRSMIEGTSNMKGFIIAERDTEQYIGQIDLHHIDWQSRSAVLGVVIGSPQYLGKGYGSEAISVMQSFVFDTLNLHRLELELLEYNERAYRCYLACGFVEEGRLRKRQYRDGRYWDVIVMSILREEFEQRQSM